MRKLTKALVATLAPAAALAGMVAVPSPASAGPYDGYLGDGSSTVPNIDTFWADEPTFYPRIRDGYRDGANFVVWTDPIVDDAAGWDEDPTIPQAWSIVIRNSSGYRVASHSDVTDGADDPRWWVGGEWNWNGRNLAGNPVGVGTFKATLTVTNTVTGEKDTATETLYARTAMTYPRVTRSRIGTSGRGTYTPSCSVDNYDNVDHLHLDCWGGRYALADYGFSLPRNAYNLSWSVTGSRGCCSNGLVIKKGVRTRPTHYNLRVKVTNWASYTVRDVTVTYTHKVLR